MMTNPRFSDSTRHASKSRELKSRINLVSDFGLGCLQVTLPWNFCCLDYGSTIISRINVGYGVLDLIALIFFCTPSSLNTLDFHPLNLLKKIHYPFFFLQNYFTAFWGSKADGTFNCDARYTKGSIVQSSCPYKMVIVWRNGFSFFQLV
jgi:hypothetical protein